MYRFVSLSLSLRVCMNGQFHLCGFETIKFNYKEFSTPETKNDLQSQLTRTAINLFMCLVVQYIFRMSDLE